MTYIPPFEIVDVDYYTHNSDDLELPHHKPRRKSHRTKTVKITIKYKDQLYAGLISRGKPDDVSDDQFLWSCI
jgi:hypothetical protein